MKSKSHRLKGLLWSPPSKKKCKFLFYADRVKCMKLINFNCFCINYFYVTIIVKSQSEPQESATYSTYSDVNIIKSSTVRRISYSDSDKNENIGEF